MLQDLLEPVVVPAWWMLLPIVEACLGLSCAVASLAVCLLLAYLGLVHPRAQIA